MQDPADMLREKMEAKPASRDKKHGVFKLSTKVLKQIET